MVHPSLHDIETSLTLLWIDRDYRHSWERERKDQKTPSEEFKALANVSVDDVNLYADLIAYGLHEVMQSVFPLCAQVLGEEQFSLLVDNYFAEVPPDHPNLNRAAKRFPEFLEALPVTDELPLPPYIAELANYEWLELDLMEQDTNFTFKNEVPAISAGNFHCLYPVLNPILAIRHYQYQIPTIVDHLLEGVHVNTINSIQTLPTSVVGARNPENFEIKFIELDQVATQFLELIANQNISYKNILSRLIQDNQSTVSADVFVENFFELLVKLQNFKVLIGSTMIAQEAI